MSPDSGCRQQLELKIQFRVQMFLLLLWHGNIELTPICAAEEQSAARPCTRSESFEGLVDSELCQDTQHAIHILPDSQYGWSPWTSRFQPSTIWREALKNQTCTAKLFATHWYRSLGRTYAAEPMDMTRFEQETLSLCHQSSPVRSRQNHSMHR